MLKAETPEKSRKFALVTRRERWSLSSLGWIILVIFGASLAIIVAVASYPFLAVTDRVPTQVLVVEGWIPPFAMHAAAEEFRSGHYRELLTTGGPVVGTGGYTNDYNTSANVGADMLKAEGVPPSAVQPVPSRVMQRDRTYGAAVALREWFRAHNFHPNGINVATEAPHARRTRFLYQKALGPKIKVGIIAFQNPDYDPTRWWEYSDGVKEVEEESLSYIYARLFFPFVK